MEATSRGSSTPRSSSRAKRSTTNLSDARLAPLSTKFADDRPRNYTTDTLAHDATYHNDFARHHASYLQGRSAPSTPGILSRSSSRKHLGGGLSRRGSLYDEDAPYHYAAAATRDQSGNVRVDVGSGQIPKAKSEAALLAQQRLSGQGVPLKKKHHARRRTGTSTPIGLEARQDDDEDDDWLTRTRASTHALLQEAKGQSWLASRDSSTSLAHLDSDDDVDEGYEEMAASARQPTRLRIDPPSPGALRVKSPAWGSRYGSRSGSRRTSRRGSTTSFFTPMAPSALEEADGYFEEIARGEQTEPDFVDLRPGAGTDENEVAKLTTDGSFGLGGIVDRIMGFNLFRVEEGRESTEDEADADEGGESDGAVRVAAEAKRRREEKERLTAVPPAPRDLGEEGQGGWQDAAWLLSVASKALF